MISKSDFTAVMQCPRQLWLKKHMPEAADESFQSKSANEGGDEVGEVARRYHGEEFVLIENDFDYNRMAAETAEALAAGRTVCEATFVAGDLVCLADVVRPTAGGLALSEVKSTTKAKEHQMRDVAFQAHVMAEAGFAPATSELLHVNGDYVRGEELDPRALLTVENMTETVDFLGAQIRKGIEAAREAATAEGEPDCAPGPHCNAPHPCPFQGRCWAGIPDDSVFFMAGMGRVRGWKWWDRGIRTPEQVAAAAKEGKMRPNALRACQLDGGEHADAAALSKYIAEKITWPVYHLDFETFQTAVPRYPGTKPYQQVPSQFSIHVQAAPGDVREHMEFLAEAGPDPRRAVAEALVAAIPEGVCVTAYNMGFEKGRIREMAAACPDLAPRLMSIHDSIVDLMTPFQKGWLYRPAQGASYSIKAVLPAFFPGDPQLDYHALPTVHNGSQAMEAFLALEALEGEELAVARDGLLRYCELDTLAMARVLDAIIAHAG